MLGAWIMASEDACVGIAEQLCRQEDESIPAAFAPSADRRLQPARVPFGTGRSGVSNAG